MNTGPLPMFGYPPTGGRRYVANEQLPRLTLFSQQDAPGFAWRSRINKILRILFSGFPEENQKG
jgi:hypothetical protein